LYSTNEEGQALCQRYYGIREQVLVSGLTGSGTEGVELSGLARASCACCRACTHRRRGPPPRSDLKQARPQIAPATRTE
jgi:hypothetical protein